MIFHEDLKKAILWQYQEAVGLVGIVEVMQRGYDVHHVDFLKRWYDDVFNLDTASRFGLRLWARILGVHFDWQYEPPEQVRPSWGFGRHRANFNRGNFLSEAAVMKKRIAYKWVMRDLLKLKYFQLTMPQTTLATMKMLSKTIGQRLSLEVDDLSGAIKWTAPVILTPSTALEWYMWIWQSTDKDWCIDPSGCLPERILHYFYFQWILAP